MGLRRIIGLMPQELESLERAVVGALRSAIKAHGPISLEWVGSAAKRVIGQIKNAKLDGLARVMGQRRWAGLSAKERHDLASSGGKKGGASAWAGMSKAERSAEMLRRAKVRAKNREAKP